MITNESVALYRSWQKSPLAFIKSVWNLTPERDNAKFERWKHLSGQQYDILLSVEKALRNEDKRRISVVAGRGIGKSTTLSWLILWYLFCFKDSQIAVTAPTSEQMHDVLWKEIAIWLRLMPKEIQECYEWQNDYVRIKQRRETWFARARTARKENPEALAGLHGEYVMLIGDEASGIESEIIKIGEGSLTNTNFLFLLISNGRRLNGYFYETQRKDRERWQNLRFSSLDSPLVDRDFISGIVTKYGSDSDEYRIEVLGEFPKEDTVDDKGFVPLFSEEEIKLVAPQEMIGDVFLGVDPSGEGQDQSAWVVRDQFKIKPIATEQTSSAKSVAEKTITIMDYEAVSPKNVQIDNFGVGADVGKEIALSNRHYNVGTVNVGTTSLDDNYLNLRAEAYFRIKTFFRQGGSIIDSRLGRELKDELLSIRFKRNIRGQIQIMSKDDMRKQGIRSPNLADSTMLCFVERQGVEGDKAHQFYPKRKVTRSVYFPQ